MVANNVQSVYDQHVATLTPAERLRLVELITRGIATPETTPADLAASLDAAPTEATFGAWQPIEQRGDRSEWRDRAL